MAPAGQKSSGFLVGVSVKPPDVPGRKKTVPPVSNAFVRPEKASPGAGGGVVSTFTSCECTDSTFPTSS